MKAFSDSVGDEICYSTLDPGERTQDTQDPLSGASIQSRIEDPGSRILDERSKTLVAGWTDGRMVGVLLISY